MKLLTHTVPDQYDPHNYHRILMFFGNEHTTGLRRLTWGIQFLIRTRLTIK